jgi:malate synthase
MSLSVAPPPADHLEPVLSPAAIEFLAELHGRFDGRRRELLEARRSRPAPSGFLAETAHIRDDPSWQTVTPAADYLDRRVEITGPTDRKLVINALNSGASGFMADFEDANAPTWHNQVEGQLNLSDAIAGTITYDASDGRHYELAGEPARLLVRPRGWHLEEAHVTDGERPISGALFDFGLYAFHNARALVDSGRRIHLYLPKLEHHLEARLWNEVLAHSESALGVATGSFRATVLIETFPAALQMDEILFELRDHSSGLNAGRWDYIFSMIKCFRDDPDHVLPDRGEVKMTVPFMRAYTELLVRTCHARGTFAMGGMAALIPNRNEPEANQRAIDAVREDKAREADAGFDGTWVAHPDVVPVARAEFDRVLGERPNQIARRRDDVEVRAEPLLDVASTPGHITEAGLRANLSIGFQYVSFWLGGRGAAGINNLMEDAATAEISRSQVWQWIRHGATLPDGRVIDRELVIGLLDEELQKIHAAVGDEVWARGRPELTRSIFEAVALAEDLPEFLTVVAYPELVRDSSFSATPAPSA